MAGKGSDHYKLWTYLLNALNAIVIADGYWTAPTVTEFDPPGPDATGGPWVVACFGEEEIGGISCGRKYDLVWRPTIDCYVVKTSTSSATNLFKLMQDVRRAIDAFAANVIAQVHTAHVTNGDASMHEGTLRHADGHVGARISVEIGFKTKDTW